MIKFRFGFCFNYKKISWELMFWRCVSYLIRYSLFNHWHLYFNIANLYAYFEKNESQFWDQKNLMLRRSVENWFCGSNLIKFGKRKQVKSVSAVFTANKAPKCFIKLVLTLKIETNEMLRYNKWTQQNDYINFSSIIRTFIVHLKESSTRKTTGWLKKMLNNKNLR